MDFKVLRLRDNTEYPSVYTDGKCETYINRVKNLEKKYNVTLPKIEKVLIGDSEYPINEIHFENGLVLLDEEASHYPSAADKNKRKIEHWLSSLHSSTKRRR